MVRFILYAKERICYYLSMDFTTFTAGKDDEGRRFDRVIKRIILSETIFSPIYKAMRKGLIKLNGKKGSENDRVCAGDEIKIASFLLAGQSSTPNEQRESEERANAEKKKFLEEHTILKTADFLIINKPYDISVQGGKENLCDIVSSVYNNARDAAANTSLSFRAGALHRLDRKTTGIQVFSQSLEGAKWFSQAIKTHIIKKTYIAIAQGKLEKSEKWIDFIDDSEEEEEKKSKNFHTVRLFSKPTQCAKEAITTAIPLAYGTYKGKDVTLIEYKIETGRKHQIRAQSSFHGYALLGDTAYGAQKIAESQSHFLHAYRLTFPKDTIFGLPEHIDAPIMTNFEKMLVKILIKWSNVTII